MWPVKDVRGWRMGNGILGHEISEMVLDRAWCQLGFDQGYVGTIAAIRGGSEVGAILLSAGV